MPNVDFPPTKNSEFLIQKSEFHTDLPDQGFQVRNADARNLNDIFPTDQEALWAGGSASK